MDNKRILSIWYYVSAMAMILSCFGAITAFCIYVEMLPWWGILLGIFSIILIICLAAINISVFKIIYYRELRFEDIEDRLVFLDHKKAKYSDEDFEIYEICPECGGQLFHDEKFCLYCGAERENIDNESKDLR